MEEIFKNTSIKTDGLSSILLQSLDSGKTTHSVFIKKFSPATDKLKVENSEKNNHEIQKVILDSINTFKESNMLPGELFSILQSVSNELEKNSVLGAKNILKYLTGKTNTPRKTCIFELCNSGLLTVVENNSVLVISTISQIDVIRRFFISRGYHINVKDLRK